MRRLLTRSFHERAFDTDALVAAKRGRSISVCLPARNEVATVGAIVETIRSELVEQSRLVDEILVIDDGSTDGTATVAAAAGARVASTAELLPESGFGTGKGEALWKSVYAADGDVIVWCDADITDFDARFVVGLLGPLLTQQDIGFVKGFYDRPVDGQPGTGGRVTELVARPIISMLFPRLTGIVQPLSGEYAGRREVLEELPFVQSYGVDLGLLIDVSLRFGLDAIAQVDLGVRVHRNRSLDELSPQAVHILQTAFTKAHLGVASANATTLGRPGLPDLRIDHVERPPLASLEAYRRRLA